MRVMDCRDAREQLLEAEDPSELAPELAGHVAACDACRQLAGEVARLEQAWRAIPGSLLENAPWLARNEDPLDEADRFDDVADKLATRMSSATRGGDRRRAGYYARLFRKVQDQGIAAKLEALEASGSLDFDRR